MSDIMQQVMEILRQRQGAVDEQAANVQRAAAPINTQFANPGQSFGDVLTNGTGAQRQALIQMAAEMGRDSSRVPGAALASGAARGFELLNQIRSGQREQNIGQAIAGLETAKEDRSAAKGYMDTASQLQHAFGEKSSEGPDRRTSGMKEYEYAVQSGQFKGTLQDWLDRRSITEQNAAAAEAATESEASMQASLASIETELMRSISVNDGLETAEDSVNFWTTGLVGDVLKSVGGTEAKDLEQVLDAVKANIGFDRLQQMRDDSKTGGALGQVSIRELDLLMSNMKSLEQAQSGTQMRKHLRQVKMHYDRFLKSAKADFEAAGGNTEELEQFEKDYRNVTGDVQDGVQSITTSSGTFKVREIK